MFRQRAPTQATEPKLWICFETLWRALCASGLAKKIETTNASPAAKLFQTPNAHQLVCFKFWFQAVASKAASASIVPAPEACFWSGLSDLSGLVWPGLVWSRPVRFCTSACLSALLRVCL